MTWGKPKHKGTRHNQRVRGGGTWTEQDRRLKRHQLGRLHRKKGAPDTWASQVRKLERPPGWRGQRMTSVILLTGVAVAAVAAGGRVLAVFAMGVAVAWAWRRFRLTRRRQ